METLQNRIIYSRKINLGKRDYNGTGRKINAVEIEIKLRQKEWGIELSICGAIWNNIHSDCVSCGQNIDTILSLMPSNPKVKRIHEIWERWHLNGMKAGCPHQIEGDYSNPAISKQYCEICKYKYGSAWLHETLPAEIIEEIKSF